MDASLKGDAPPKEIDIALDVFGKDKSFDVHEDSIVRVYVHSLRGKLDEYYRHVGQNDELKIDIPKGGYRVVAILQKSLEEPAAEAAPPSPMVSKVPRRGGPPLLLYGFVGVILLVSILGNIYFGLLQTPHAPNVADKAADTFPWRALVRDNKPITIVLGDLYFYSEMDPELGRMRFIGDVPVNSRESLRRFLTEHPDRVALMGGPDTTLLTKGTAYGLAAIIPILHGHRGEVKPTILDELDLDVIRKDDVIYIGPLHRLGPLAALYNSLSRYDYDRPKNRLTDRKTGKVMEARDPMSREGVDYGLFAEFRGPDGNRIMIFTSVASDIGLLQIVRSMTSKTELEHIRQMLIAQGDAKPDSFEALFSATGYDRTDLSAKIVEVHPLDLPAAVDGSGRL